MVGTGRIPPSELAQKLGTSRSSDHVTSKFIAALEPERVSIPSIKAFRHETTQGQVRRSLDNEKSGDDPVEGQKEHPE